MSDKQQMIDEDEWADRFGWSVNRGNVSNLLEGFRGRPDAAWQDRRAVCLEPTGC